MPGDQPGLALAPGPAPGGPAGRGARYGRAGRQRGRPGIVRLKGPRETPSGEQMDFVEVMELEDGLIHAHRVYWGWRGVDVLINDQYHLD